MTIKAFVDFVELRTKVASMLPFIIGIFYTLYRYQTFKGLHLLVFGICLICVDMGTTALNNYMDYKKAVAREGYNYEQHNAVVSHGIDPSTAKRIICFLFGISVCLGLILTVMTDLIIFIIGVFAFGVGLAYSYGPIPISRTPLGELFSGILMGTLIFFVTVYCQIYTDGYMILQLLGSSLHLVIEIKEIGILLLVSIPLTCYISNIMLANNLCDLEEDIKENRYTLPYYLGRERALVLFQILTYIPFLLIVVYAFLQIIPIDSLLVLVLIKPIYDRVQRFKVVQTKKDTFVIAVKNFVNFGAAYGISILLGYLIVILL